MSSGKLWICRILTVLSVSLLIGSCGHDGLSPSAEHSGYPLFDATAAPPALLRSITLGNGSLSIWPYTGMDFSGSPLDPVNLIFTGRADPRAIRQALMSIDGNRTGFGMPAAYPFNCVWSDAIGDLQTGYNAAAGWV